MSGLQTALLNSSKTNLWSPLESWSILCLVFLFSFSLQPFLALLSFPKNPAFSWCALSRTAFLPSEALFALWPICSTFWQSIVSKKALLQHHTVYVTNHFSVSFLYSSASTSIHGEWKYKNVYKLQSWCLMTPLYSWWSFSNFFIIALLSFSFIIISWLKFQFGLLIEPRYTKLLFWFLYSQCKRFGVLL